MAKSFIRLQKEMWSTKYNSPTMLSEAMRYKVNDRKKAKHSFIRQQKAKWGKYFPELSRRNLM